MEFLYKAVSIVLFLFLSSVLLYHRHVTRWLGFTAGFFLVYLAGNLVFFNKLPVPATLREAITALPAFLFFFAFAAVLGVSLYRQLSIVQTIGLLLLTGVIMAGLASTEAFQQSFPQIALYTRNGIEISSVALVGLGVLGVVGFGLLNEWSGRQTTGALIVLLALGAGVMGLVALTIGYETIWPEVKARIDEIIPALNR